MAANVAVSIGMHMSVDAMLLRRLAAGGTLPGTVADDGLAPVTPFSFDRR